MQRCHRADRESDHWLGALKAIGAVPQNACWVSVGDRESDIVDYWDKAKALGWQCLLRLAQDRCIVREDGTKDRLRQWSAQLPVQAVETLALRTRPHRCAQGGAIAHVGTNQHSATAEQPCFPCSCAIDSMGAAGRGSNTPASREAAGMAAAVDAAD